MNLPNQLTLARIALAALFMFFIFLTGFWFKLAALLAFLLASLTDYWDGRIARSRSQVTSFGKLMDPIADKVLTLSAFLVFVQMDLIPAWMAVAILTRDFLITGLRLTLPENHASIAARNSGRHKTVLQFASIVGILIFILIRETQFWKPDWTNNAQDFIYFSMLFIVTITLTSGIHYVWQNKKLFL